MVKKDCFIALEIGTDALRMAVFDRSRPGIPVLVDHGSSPYDVAPGVEMAREARVATALRRLLEEKRPAAREVVLAIDGQSVFSRVANLPPVPADKMPQTIRHEAVQNIPFPIEEVVWAAGSPVAGPSGLEILLVAAKADLVNGLVHAVAANGLEVVRVEVAPVALANVVRFHLPGLQDPLLLVDAGNSSANLVFLCGGRTLFRTLPVPAHAVPRLVQEIERSISFFRSQQGGAPPVRILLGGGGTAVASELEERLALPVEPFDPLQRIEAVPPASGSAEFGVLAGLAVPLAFADALDIDLSPPEVRAARGARRRRPMRLAAAGMALLAGLAWIAGLVHATRLAQRENGMVLARVGALERIEREQLPIERSLGELQERAAMYERLVDRRTAWLDALSELRGLMPEGMFLLQSEPISTEGEVAGVRITVLSYLDKEPPEADVVVQLRDRIRACDRFDAGTSVYKRPAKRLFSRRFVLDVRFKEPLPK